MIGLLICLAIFIFICRETSRQERDRLFPPYKGDYENPLDDPAFIRYRMKQTGWVEKDDV